MVSKNLSKNQPGITMIWRFYSRHVPARLFNI
jgi:hypothetical protein